MCGTTNVIILQAEKNVATLALLIAGIGAGSTTIRLPRGSSELRNGHGLRVHGAARHVGLPTGHPDAHSVHRHVSGQFELSEHQLRDGIVRFVLQQRRR